MAKSSNKHEWVGTYTFNNGDTHIVTKGISAATVHEASKLMNAFIDNTLSKNGNPSNLYVVASTLTIAPPRGRRPRAV